MWTLNKIESAGELANGRHFTVRATYGDETPRRFSFTGTPYGMGPVYVAVEGFGEAMRVESPERFGETFDADWIRRYFA